MINALLVNVIVGHDHVWSAEGMLILLLDGGHKDDEYFDFILNRDVYIDGPGIDPKGKRRTALVGVVI
jgi:hypothetical protein